MLAGVLGCEVGSLPTVYLGLSLGAKSKALEIWNSVIERCEKRLSNLKGQYLSLGSRIILVNSVLDALPTYVMSLFPDSLRRNFIWQGNKEKKAIHLVKWECLITSKKDGGLGIRDLKAHNQSLLMKWLWRYNLETDALWRRFIHDKYGQDDQWCSNSVNCPFGVGVWRAIRSFWPLLAGNVSFKVGNGRKILFWHDNWLGHGPLKVLFPNFYTIATLPDINLESAKGVHEWNITFRRLLHDWELERVVDLFKTLESFQGFKESEDRLCWKSGSDGVYTVKSAYNY
ncbi:hypothetical protein MTR67_032307 [Solanum verrucosum]|uniref:Uncharacterized protein n=1 Tax=Solanum verrucosum TaxID=315347 RepID=A0AAF0U492_SOLVR|nr:hypothetical protein MTR67_032307 [Solanum verrucosum]